MYTASDFISSMGAVKMVTYLIEFKALTLIYYANFCKKI